MMLSWLHSATIRLVLSTAAGSHGCSLRLRRRGDLLRGLGVTPVILTFDESLRRLTAEEFIGRLASEYGIERLLLGFNNSIGSDRCSSDEDLRRVSEATGVEIIRATELPGR